MKLNNNRIETTNMADGEYGNVHKGFLQMIINYGSVSKAQAIEMYRDCLENGN